MKAPIYNSRKKVVVIRDTRTTQDSYVGTHIYSRNGRRELYPDVEQGRSKGRVEKKWYLTPGNYYQCRYSISIRNGREDTVIEGLELTGVEGQEYVHTIPNNPQWPPKWLSDLVQKHVLTVITTLDAGASRVGKFTLI